MAENPRKDAFKRSIGEYMRSAGARASVPKETLIAAVRAEFPDLFNDDERCYPGCKAKHPKWRHEFDRAVYDLTQTRPAKIKSDSHQRGLYRLP